MTEEYIAEVHARYTSTERDWEAFRPLMGSPIHLMRDTLERITVWLARWRVGSRSG